MSSCKDMSLLSQSTLCNTFWADYMKDEILAKSSNSRLVITSRDIYLNRMSEFKTIHMLLYFLLLSSCNSSLLHKRTQFSPCMMLANPLTLSQLLMVSISPLSLDFALNSVLSFRSPLVVIQRSFSPPISIMPSISSPLKGQKCCPVHQNSHHHH